MTAPSPHAPRPAAAPHFRLRRGLDLAIDGAPAQGDAPGDGSPVTKVALLGDDAPGVRPELRVALGDRVRSGQTLWVDRRRPELCFASPGAGVVKEILRGERRRLAAVVVALEGDDEERFDAVAPADVALLPRERLEPVLLASGLWTTLRTRPYGHVPDPGSTPRSILVSALETDPLAPRVAPLLRARAEDFARGVAALTRLTPGTVFVCARGDGMPTLPDAERVVPARFDGPHPAGLPGTHAHFLDPVDPGPGRTVWHVGWQDVAAIGRLLVTGRLPTERIVALGGPSLVNPRLVRTRLGASTEDLLRGELRGGPCRVISGSVLSGRQAVGSRAYLGRLHTQVCVLPEGAAARPRGLFGGRAWTTALGGRRSAFFPLERFESVFPLDLPLLPLLRALAVGNVDAVQALGGLELVEEDLALVSYLCPGKLDYGALLRAALVEIERRSA